LSNNMSVDTSKIHFRHVNVTQREIGLECMFYALNALGMIKS